VIQKNWLSIRTETFGIWKGLLLIFTNWEDAVAGLALLPNIAANDVIVENS
jgi:hypothetical protein